jgi:tRNA-splicing ligase RtcB
MKKPCKIYAELLEPTALEQFYSAMALDCVIQGALMPDAHTGYSLPIGAVIATEDFVVPSWVGYDIGCGVCALPTTFYSEDVKNHAVEIHKAIHRRVPTGFSCHSKKQQLGSDLMPGPDVSKDFEQIFFDRKAQFQFGSLGGGNHFIEVGIDEYDKVWIIIHSGSRGVGHGTAQHYMRLASGDGKVREGHFGLDVESEEGQNYLKDHRWCLKYALGNRKAMLHAVKDVIASFCQGLGEWDDLINRTHNHVERTNWGYKDAFIHRKGATHAMSDMPGVIPGNMQDGSFIVKGKGNPESLWSSSHGAGRIMSRKKAKATFAVEGFRATMGNIVADISEKTLDECPAAYKNIFEVMEQQTDLVEVLHHVQPILNVKG